jgi:hypothetical protein
VKTSRREFLLTGASALALSAAIFKSTKVAGQLANEGRIETPLGGP